MVELYIGVVDGSELNFEKSFMYFNVKKKMCEELAWRMLT